jgi:hypothetical protein
MTARPATIKIRAFGEVREVEIASDYTDRLYTAPVFAARFRTGTKVWKVQGFIVRQGKYADPVDEEGVVTLRHLRTSVLNTNNAWLFAWWDEAKHGGGRKSRHNSAWK